MNLQLTSNKLTKAFYERDDTVAVAKDLLGKLVVTRFNDLETIARIVETEAYCGSIDKASHAYNNRRTTRTEIMYNSGGVAYVYLCYGIHHLFNVVTGKAEIPNAVLIRGVEPVYGMDIMMKRTGRLKWDRAIGSGPGNVTKALGIETSHTGLSLNGEKLYLVDDGFQFSEEKIIATPRIGVDYAGEDALLPFRFAIAGHPQVSAKSFTSKFI